MTLAFSRTPTFEFEFLRIVSHTRYGGADIGECFVTARRIIDGDFDSWYYEWTHIADRVAEQAREAEDAGHHVSARDAWLRASNYYRAADFFLHALVPDPRIDRVREASAQCFRAALPALGHPAELFRIPFDGTSLPAYLFTPDNTGRTRPTLIMHNGFDGTGEECYFIGGRAAVERGYNVLAFEGPGQGEVLHHSGLVFRPDWENVVSPVLDRLVAHPGVDARRIALLGISMGGMLAPRAAAFDPRISAVIACDGVYDMFDFAVGLIPLPREEAAARIAAESDVGLDELLDEVIEHNSVARWSTDHGRWCFGAPSSRAFLAMLRDYHLKDGIAERISCPTLVMKAERDFAFPGQPELLYQHLHCNKALVEFTIDEGAGAHCHFGGMTLACARMLDWLDHVFKAR